MPRFVLEVIETVRIVKEYTVSADSEAQAREYAFRGHFEDSNLLEVRDYPDVLEREVVSAAIEESDSPDELTEN
jgi:hypothetical protein